MLINTKFRSPNYSVRTQNINFIILHYTEMRYEDALTRLCNPEALVSSHYLIRANGEIINLVDDQYVAWHAGVSAWGEYEGLNESSIGIELDNLGYLPYAEKQMNSCINLCKRLLHIYNISKNNVLGHSDIAPARKIDPGIFFDWGHLAEHDIGLWFDNKLLEEKNYLPEILFNFGDQTAEILALQNNLKKLGYRLKPTGIFDEQTNYVIRAFLAHFHPEVIHKLDLAFYQDNDSKYSWDQTSDKILKNIESLVLI